MQSLTPEYLSALRFGVAEAAVFARLGEGRGRQALFQRQTPQVLEKLRQVAMIESTESSNRLEGIVATRDRIEALVLKNSQPRDRPEEEIAGYQTALGLVHESYEHMPFTVNIIRQLHAMTYRFLPGNGGHFKPTDNEIVERDGQGRLLRVRFRAVSAVATPGAMDLMAERYQQSLMNMRHEPLVLVPLTILDFLCIHPFADGNGRVSRLLTLLLLYHHGYYVGRWISLERIFEESKESYYHTLHASSQGWHEGKHDALPWLTYFWGVLIAATKEFEERVGTLSRAKGTKTGLIREAVNRRFTPFSIGDIEQDCPGVSRDMVRHVLRQMRDEQAIEVVGAGPTAKWKKIH